MASQNRSLLLGFGVTACLYITETKDDRQL